MPIDFEAEAREVKTAIEDKPLYSSPITPQTQPLPSPSPEGLNNLSPSGGQGLFWKIFAGVFLFVIVCLGLSSILVAENGMFKTSVNQSVTLEPEIDVNNAYQHQIENNHTIQIENKIYVDQVVCGNLTQ